MERLPFAGVSELAGLFNACEECLSRPWQTPLVAGKLLGKTIWFGPRYRLSLIHISEPTRPEPI
eukprot:7304940-Pyramimonas_sp.AAC.1